MKTTDDSTSKIKHMFAIELCTRHEIAKFSHANLYELHQVGHQIRGDSSISRFQIPCPRVQDGSRDQRISEMKPWVLYFCWSCIDLVRYVQRSTWKCLALTQTSQSISFKMVEVEAQVRSWGCMWQCLKFLPWGTPQRRDLKVLLRHQLPDLTGWLMAWHGLTAWQTFPEILWIRGAAACSRLESHCYDIRPHLRSCGGWTAFWIRFRSTGMQMAIHIAKCQSQTSDAKVMVGLISSWYSTELSMQLWNL